MSTTRRPAVFKLDDTTLDSGRNGSVRRAIRATAGVAVVGWLLLGAVAVELGVFVTRVLAPGWDGDAVRWLVAHRTGFWNDLSSVGSQLAAGSTITALTILVAALLIWQRRWPLVALVVVAPILEGAVYLTATFFVHRERPRVPRLESLIHYTSFYSGHTAAAVATYGALAIVVHTVTRQARWRVAAYIVALTVPVVVALARMYRGMHFPTDTLSGALIGIGCIGVALAAARAGVAADGRHRTAPGPHAVERETHASPTGVERGRPHAQRTPVRTTVR
jgi:membrane-associated phospholipid phosphatase